MARLLVCAGASVLWILLFWWVALRSSSHGVRMPLGYALTAAEAAAFLVVAALLPAFLWKRTRWLVWMEYRNGGPWQPVAFFVAVRIAVRVAAAGLMWVPALSLSAALTTVLAPGLGATREGLLLLAGLSGAAAVWISDAWGVEQWAKERLALAPDYAIASVFLSFEEQERLRRDGIDPKTGGLH